MFSAVKRKRRKVEREGLLAQLRASQQELAAERALATEAMQRSAATSHSLPAELVGADLAEFAAALSALCAEGRIFPLELRAKLTALTSILPVPPGDIDAMQVRGRVLQLEMALAEAHAATQAATQEAHTAARQRAEGQARLAAVEQAREAAAMGWTRRQLELEERVAEEREARLLAERGGGQAVNELIRSGRRHSKRPGRRRHAGPAPLGLR